MTQPLAFQTNRSVSAPQAHPSFSASVLDLDCAVTANEIEQVIRDQTSRTLHRRGVVIGVSGGIDSSVCAALAVRALGQERVLALLMPERESSPESLANGRAVCDALNIHHVVEDVTAPLEALGCYFRRAQAIRTLFPEFPGDGLGGRFKITLAGDLLDSDRLTYFNITVEVNGSQRAARMPLDVYLAVVAATNMKQRVRTLVQYSHADRLNYAVLGTPNRLEYDQGFFVRGGDGLADLKPIAHLYKTQVHQMARFLGLPEAICNQRPTTDTYSLPQTQEEFFFGVPHELMDLLLHAQERDVPAERAAAALNLAVVQVERAFRDIVSKRRVASLLHQDALLVKPLHVDSSRQ